MNIAFYLAAAVALVSTVMVITRTNAVHALLYMVLSLLSVAVIFYTLGAPFIAALEVITYAGAIMVLFVFVVMLLGMEQEHSHLVPADATRHPITTRSDGSPAALSAVPGVVSHRRVR